MTEELLVTARANELIDPALHIWTWEVAMYLFLGGLTAGIMVFAACMTLCQVTDGVSRLAKRVAPVNHRYDLAQFEHVFDRQ
jgi:formate-dependent nitrite reductase membrane component NrfD